MSRAHSFTPIITLKFDGITNDRNKSLTFEIDDVGVYRIVEKNEIWSLSPEVVDTVDLIFNQLIQQQSNASPLINEVRSVVCGEVAKIVLNPTEKRKLNVVVNIRTGSVNI